MLSPHYSLGAHWIHTMTGPPLEKHYINVHDGVIESFTATPTKDECFDLGSEFQILPATFNMHTHLELSQLTEPLDVPSTAGRRSMADWVGELMRFRRSPKYNAAEAVIAGMMREDILTETAAVADIVPLDFNAEILRQGKRWCDFRELIGWNENIATEKLAALENLRFFGLSPHAPQTVCPKLLEGCVQKARKLDGPVAMHLAETPEEIEFLRTGTGPLRALMHQADPDYDPKHVLLGKRPLDYLKLLSEAPKTLVIHGQFLDDEELRFLAARRETMAVVYCPRSTAYFGSDEYPLQKMLDFGVRVLLGTDSLASTPDLSVVNEMAFVLRNYPGMAAKTVVRMGTIDAAEFLFREKNAGALREGGPARFTFLATRIQKSIGLLTQDCPWFSGR